MKNLKHNTKKYIAGILTIALAAGVCQSYGSMEVSAHEMTLPGIEKLVQDTVASSDGTFHILEIVPSKRTLPSDILSVARNRYLKDVSFRSFRQHRSDYLPWLTLPVAVWGISQEAMAR